MINWTHIEEEFCEGTFKSAFFRDDEGGDILQIGAKSHDLADCAEKCVEAFNALTQAEITEICDKIIECIKEDGLDDGFELPENSVDILESCWFTMLYVNMLSHDDNVAFVVEGEGDWGEVIGFAYDNGKLVYVGTDYFSCMKG